MALFCRYLKQRVGAVAAFLLFSLLFAISFLLYHLPVRAVIYPALLCALLGALFLLIDFQRVKRRHQHLLALGELTAAMIVALPEAWSVQEADYQNIVAHLQREVAELDTVTSTRYQDMVDYYTLWVHQIKTPIASMRLQLQSEDTPFSRRLSSDLFRVEQYVEMVLAFLRLDAPSSDYVFREQAIDPLVRQAVKKFAPEFIDRRITLEYEPIPGTLITDEKWFSLALEQILSNALKYTREGRIRIYLAEPKTLCVEDTGIGIAPEDLPRIFERGYTGYNGRSDKKASGIGLYLCKRIFQNLGAEIRAESAVGRGTVICIGLDQYRLKKE